MSRILDYTSACITNFTGQSEANIPIYIYIHLMTIEDHYITLMTIPMFQVIDNCSNGDRDKCRQVIKH